jgi:hypothetical protein
MRRYTYKRIDGVTYKLPSMHQDRENSIGLSESDMLDILKKAEDNSALKNLLMKVKHVYFIAYSDSVHSGGVKTLACDDVQQMTDEQLYDHNIVLDIVKKAQDLGW